MTYEQKAKEVADAILEYLLVDGENVSASVLNPAREIITTALREAGNAKLEEAACAATAAGNLWAKSDRDPTRAGCGMEIATLIRSLIEKD